MSSRPAIVMWACLAVSLCSSGCALMEGGRNWFAGKSGDQSEPDVADDKWAFVGKEARGNRRAEKQDPLDHLLWSDKAADINRNLGYD